MAAKFLSIRFTGNVRLVSGKQADRVLTVFPRHLLARQAHRAGAHVVTLRREGTVAI